MSDGAGVEGWRWWTDSTSLNYRMRMGDGGGGRRQADEEGKHEGGGESQGEEGGEVTTRVGTEVGVR